MATDVPLSIKYRPKKLSDVIGQPVVVKAFQNAFKYKTLHHAYILAGKFGCGKCVTGDTLVLTGEGLKYIKDMVPNKKGISHIDYRVIDEQGEGETYYGYFEEQSPTKRIKNNLGIEIEGTLEHPLRVFNKDNCSVEWKKMEDLVVGDCLPVYRRPLNSNKSRKPIPTGGLITDIDILKSRYINSKSKDFVSKNKNDKVECPICKKKLFQLNTHLKTHNITVEDFKNKYGEDFSLHGRKFHIDNIKKSIKDISLPIQANRKLSRFIGYLLAEGNIDNNTIIFTNSNKEVLKDFESISKDLFGVEIKKTRDDRREGLYNYKIHSALLVYYLNDLGGINFKSSEKYISQKVFRWGRLCILDLLKALFESDGGINGKRVSYYTISHRLGSEIQQLLLSIGIVSYFRQEKKKCTNYTRIKNHISYSVNISGIDLKKYYDCIGFLSTTKKKKLLEIVGNNGTNKDTVPGIACKVHNFIKEYLPISKSGKIMINDKFYSCPKKPENFTAIAKRNGRLSYAKLVEIILYLEEMLSLVSDKVNDRDVVCKINDMINLCFHLYDSNYYYSEIVEIKNGQSDVYDICKHDDDKSFIANGYISHNTTVARIIAAMENCVKGPTQEPCGECKNCVEIFDGRSFDVRELDAASNRGVDDVRLLKKEIYQSPLECRTKYSIIDEAHSLTGIAAEAALKMIEEPPDKVRFILATTDPHKLKDTIHSRCIMWKFNKVGWAELYSHIKNIAIKEELDFDDAALKICAKSSKGSVRNALQNLQTLMNYVGGGKITVEAAKEALGAVDEKLYFDLMESIANMNAAKALYYINCLLMDGKEIGLIINGINTHVSHLLKARILQKDLSQFDFSEEEAKRYCEQSDAMVSGKALLSMMKHLREISFGINYNLDPQAELEEFVINAIQEVKMAKNRLLQK